jgi:hypothetical protein
MRIEARIFLAVAAFLFVVAVIYGIWSGEVAGTTCLVLSGGLALIIGSYFGFVARRIEPRPEDRLDAEVAEGAGELGFFSPASYWPLGIGLGAFLAGIALAFFQTWMIILAFAVIMLGVAGLLFEYYTGQNTSHHSAAETMPHEPVN